MLSLATLKCLSSLPASLPAPRAGAVRPRRRSAGKEKPCRAPRRPPDPTAQLGGGGPPRRAAHTLPPLPDLQRCRLLPRRSSLPSYLPPAGAEPGGQRGRPSAARGERGTCERLSVRGRAAAAPRVPGARHGAAGGEREPRRGGAAGGAAGGEGGLQGNPGTVERRLGGGQGRRETATLTITGDFPSFLGGELIVGWGSCGESRGATPYPGCVPLKLSGGQAPPPPPSRARPTGRGA